MSKRTVYECDICGRDVGCHLINRFKRTYFVGCFDSPGIWKTNGFDICDSCLNYISSKICNKED